MANDAARRIFFAISVYRQKSPFCRKAGGGLSNKTILFFYCAYFCNVIIKQNIQQSKNNKKTYLI